MLSGANPLASPAMTHSAPSLIADIGLSSPHIPGLSPDSVKRLCEDDLAQILLPSHCLKDGGWWRGESLGSDAPLLHAARSRMERLDRFLQRAASIAIPFAGQPSPVRFESLAGDSHNGASRPLLLHFAGHPMVLKFADPRPYQLLSEVLAALSDGVGVDLKMPSIIPDPGNEWYLVPFLPDSRTALYDVDRYMFSMGALVAVAYCLHMTDLHLENIVVDGEKPVIIDPEFILYNFDRGDPADRLRNTGLLSHNVHLSSLRGGDVAKVPMFTLDAHRNADGAIDYRRPVSGFRNRVREVCSLDLADPAKFRSVVAAGYQAAYAWAVRNKDGLCDIIGRVVQDDFRIRFLFRKTRQYVAVTHTLNLPCLYGADIWQQGILERLKASGSFSPRPSRRAVKAEWEDLLARDIPYFWIEAGDTKIRHRSGMVQDWKRAECPRALAMASIQALRHEEVGAHISVLNQFFDIDLTGHRRAA
jgi:lantibiotic modifying enzyme